MTDVVKTLEDMVARLSNYERPRKAIAAHIDALEKTGGLFTWAPTDQGKPLMLPESVEKKCQDAVLRTLRAEIKRIDDHISRVQALVGGSS